MLTRLGRDDGRSAVHGSEGRKETGAGVVATLAQSHTYAVSHLDKLHNCSHVNVYIYVELCIICTLFWERKLSL